MTIEGGAKVCPILTKRTGRIVGEVLPSMCVRDRCAWWVDGECALTVIAKALRQTGFSGAGRK